MCDTLNDSVPPHRPSAAVVHYHQDTLRKHKAYSQKVGGSQGSTLKHPELLAQMLAVIGCLASGVPLKAQENPLMTEFLQFLGARLPGGSHLNQHVPFILKEEVKMYK